MFTASNTIDTTPAGPGHPGEWVSLRLLNSYRLFVALIFLTAFFAVIPPAVELGRAASLIFNISATGYLIAGALFALTLHQRRPSAGVQAYLHFYTDVVALCGVMYASGGVDSGLGVLLIIPVAGAGILLPMRDALLYAALATLGGLTSEVIRHQGIGANAADYPGAALLGAMLFATALLAALLARQSAQIAAIARQRTLDVRRLSRLNDQIIQHMESGILVVTARGTIAMANASAHALLDCEHIAPEELLEDVAPGVARSLAVWQGHPHAPLHPIEIEPDSRREVSLPSDRPRGRRLQPQFTDLGDSGTLIALEDATFIEEQVQQLKLASLGRLTASIAHEIRNPLGAISHSAQLLRETDALPATDRRLVEIQVEHCGRIDRIVESVLLLSQRRKRASASMRLLPWLEEFAVEFRRSRGLAGERIVVHATGDFPTSARVPSDQVSFNPEQLHQVLANLCGNSLQHGQRDDGVPVRVRLQPGSLEGDIPASDPFLDIADDGRPIAPERLSDIFEPFYSTSRTGTGLGLFLARELCEANGARLRYIRAAAGNRFRILFSRPATSEPIAGMTASTYSEEGAT